MDQCLLGVVEVGCCCSPINHLRHCLPPCLGIWAVPLIDITRKLAYLGKARIWSGLDKRTAIEERREGQQATSMIRTHHSLFQFQMAEIDATAVGGLVVC